MKKLFLLLSCLFYLASLSAQISIPPLDTMSSSGRGMPILHFPADQLPKGIDSLYFVYFMEADSLLLYGKNKKGDYARLDEIEKGDFYNDAKNYADALEYTNGKVEICSQMPFKATDVCMYYRWEDGHFVYDNEIIYDPNDEYLERADSALAAGNVQIAIANYNSLQYPMSYINPEDVFFDLLMVADSVAMVNYKKNNFKGAVELLDEVSEFWGNTIIETLKTPEDIATYFSMDRGKLTAKKLIDIYANYGLYLLKNKDYQRSITINEMVTAWSPKTAGLYLQLGDAYYELGNKKQAAASYKTYKSLMTAAKKTKSIPKRVNERL